MRRISESPPYFECQYCDGWPFSPSFCNTTCTRTNVGSRKNLDSQADPSLITLYCREGEAVVSVYRVGGVNEGDKKTQQVILLCLFWFKPPSLNIRSLLSICWQWRYLRLFGQVLGARSSLSRWVKLDLERRLCNPIIILKLIEAAADMYWMQ